MNEECGVVGIYNINDAAYLAKTGLYMLQHRGQEAAGIISYDNKFHKHKDHGLVNSVFDKQALDSLHGKVAIGHVRYSTSGDQAYENIQPFLFYNQKINFALCHNGNIVNSKQIKSMLSSKGVLFQSNSDSEVLGHLIMTNLEDDFIQALKISLNMLQGAFSFLIIYDNKLYCCRDKYFMRPLALSKYQDGYIVSSETCTFNALDSEYLFDIKGGEIVELSSEGINTHKYASDTENRICSMEYIYFSRPDSNIDNMNIYTVRKQLGIRLAKDYKSEIEQFSGDIVVGVPDSSLPCAVGFSFETKLEHELALVKHKYSGRSFIEPTRERRDLAVKLKLTVIDELVYQKNVILIDDSIVRGTTSKKLIEKLKKAGAKKIMLLVASPMIIDKCYFGVDIHSKEELISYQKNLEQVREYIGCDSLHYLKVDSLKEVLKNQNICVGCFTSKYPNYIGD